MQTSKAGNPCCSQPRQNSFKPFNARYLSKLLGICSLFSVFIASIKLHHLLFSYEEQRDPWTSPFSLLAYPKAINFSGSLDSLSVTKTVPELWPSGCRWRTITASCPDDPKTPCNTTKATATATPTPKTYYQYWSDIDSSWTLEQPQQCRLSQSSTITQGYDWLGGTPAVGGECLDTYCIFQNLWMKGGEFYLLSEPGIEVPGAIKLSRQRVARKVAVKSASEFANGVEVVAVQGTTAVIDWAYLKHLGAIGHWPEYLAPLFSVFAKEPASRLTLPPDQVVILGQHRSQITDWVRGMMGVGLGVVESNGTMLPPLWLQEEYESLSAQRDAPLEGSNRDRWICFERVVWVQDVFTSGTREFFTQEDAQHFRRLVYARHGLPVPPHLSPPPTITLLRKSTNRRILNENQLLTMLQSLGHGPVRVVEFSSATPFSEQVQVMAGTGVLVSVHTSGLANAMLLPPGAAVFEILPRSWSWAHIDQAFAAFSWALGDVFHFAWRASGNFTVFIDPRNQVRFGGWATEECNPVVACVEALTKTDVLVDVDALRVLMESKLKLVRQKEWRASELHEPWPEPD